MNLMKRLRQRGAVVLARPVAPPPVPSLAAVPGDGVRQRFSEFDPAESDGRTKAATAGGARVAPQARAVVKVEPGPNGVPAPVRVDDRSAASTVRRSMLVSSTLPDFDPEDLSTLEGHGKLLTVEGYRWDGERYYEKRMSDFLALFTSGLFLVARSHMSDITVDNFYGQIRVTATRIEPPMAVDQRVIRAIYAREKSVRSASARASGRPVRDVPQRQQEICQIIKAGADINVSDCRLNLQPSQNRTLIRWRNDGIYRQCPLFGGEMPSGWGDQIMRAAYSMTDAAGTHYQEFELQGGRINGSEHDFPETVQSVRLAYIPLVNKGRLLVVRFLYSTDTHGEIDLHMQGYTPLQVQQLEYLLSLTQGISLITGKMGSGKSTTIEKLLIKLLRDSNGEKAIAMAEDPPEMVIDGVEQAMVPQAETEEKLADNYVRMIRGFLRADLDVAVVGEIRDEASAKAAFRLANTSSRVLSTLHTIGCVHAVPQLRQFGLPLDDITDPMLLNGLVSQKLVRKLCPTCKLPLLAAIEQGAVDRAVVERLKNYGDVDPAAMFVARVNGEPCPSKCAGGYRGRTVVAEILIPDHGVMEFIRRDDRDGATRYWMKELSGMQMIDHAVSKLVEGIVSPFEVERVFGSFEQWRFRKALLESSAQRS